MQALLAVLQLATSLTPLVQTAIPVIESAFAGNPISAAEGDTVAKALNAATEVIPQLQPILPIVQKQFNGEEINDTDLATLNSVSDALDGLIAAKVQAIEDGSATGSAPQTAPAPDA